MTENVQSPPSTDLGQLVDGLDAIIWEGDAQTFQFTYVSQKAESLLGYPLERWLEPGFWAETVGYIPRTATRRSLSVL